MSDTRSPATGLTLHRAEFAEGLVDALAVHLTACADPFWLVPVCVPGPGQQRWLGQQLSLRLGADGAGVCAGLDFVSPARLARTLAVTPDDDPWRPGSLTWAVLSTVDEHAGEPWLGLVEHHLGAPGDPTRPGRRYATAARVARLFHRYASERPALLQGWTEGRDDVPTDAAWQPPLWRAVAQRLGETPVHRLEAQLLRLAEGPSPFGPELHVVLPGRLPQSTWRLLHAASATSAVHVWTQVPSLVVARAQAGGGWGPRVPGVLAQTTRQRLNERLGRDTAELAAIAGALATRTDDRPGDVPPPRTLLSRLQAAVRADDPRPAGPVPTADGSIQVHDSHGPDRQVEVLRDVLTGLVQDDPTLEPRDLVVLCPDLTTFGPLVTAAFSAPAGEPTHPAQQLRVQVSDRSLRRLNPVLDALSAVLELAGSRAEASALLDLCALPAIARRFGFDDEAVARIRELVEASGVKWGIDYTTRAPFGLAGFGQNTWIAGLDRMLLGLTAAPDDAVTLGTALPLDDIDSSDADLVGSLMELVVRVRTIVGWCAGQHPLSVWVDRCRAVLDLLVAVPASDEWQLAHARGLLADIADAAPASTSLLAVGDLRALLDDQWRRTSDRASFGNGSLLVCSPAALRQVPHRVVALLGIDDHVFPRVGAADGDDLLARAPLVGDRDARSEDRQLLLDAVMAAREHLVIVHQGADQRTNDRLPDAVPLAELLDAVADLDPTRQLARQIRHQHPLQPYAPGPFSGTPVSFDRAALAGARVAAAPRTLDAQPFAGVQLPEPALDTVSLDDLVRFLGHPARALLRTRGGIYLRDESAPDDDIPLELDGLQRWAVGQRLLDLVLTGMPLAEAERLEWLRGALPPRALGAAVLDSVAMDVGDIAARAGSSAGDTAPLHHDVWAPVDGCVVAGRVATRGETLSSATFSWINARHRLSAWAQLLALRVSDPDRPWAALLHGKRESLRIESPEPDAARAQLTHLVTLYRRGLCQPLPLPPKVSAEYARLRRMMPDPSSADWVGRLRRTWDDERDRAWTAFFGPQVDALLTTVVDGPDGSPWALDDLVMGLWGPLLAAEVRL